LRRAHPVAPPYWSAGRVCRTSNPARHRQSAINTVLGVWMSILSLVSSRRRLDHTPGSRFGVLAMLSLLLIGILSVRAEANLLRALDTSSPYATMRSFEWEMERNPGRCLQVPAGQPHGTQTACSDTPCGGATARHARCTAGDASEGRHAVVVRNGGHPFAPARHPTDKHARRIGWTRRRSAPTLICARH